MEKMWSKAKGFLRSVAAGTTEAVSNALGGALRQVRVPDIVGWFRSCGLAWPTAMFSPRSRRCPGAVSKLERARNPVVKRSNGVGPECH
jgi:hypothetical protein